MTARHMFTAIGLLSVLIGLLWMGQGSGYFPYPAASFMIDQRPWIGYGAGLVLFGLVVIGGARRLLR